MVTTDTGKKIIVPASPGTTEFTFTFPLSSSSQLRFVYTTTDGIELFLDVTNSEEASLSAANNNFSGGGKATAAIYTFDTDDIIALYRFVEFTQEIDFVQSDKASSRNRQNALDKLVQLVQYINDLTAGVMTYPIDESFNTILPVVADRASMVGRWDSDGEVYFSAPTATEDPDDSIMGRISSLILRAESRTSFWCGLGFSPLMDQILGDADFSAIRTGVGFEAGDITIDDASGLLASSNQEDVNDEIFEMFTKRVNVSEAVSFFDPVGYDGFTYKKVGESQLVANTEINPTNSDANSTYRRNIIFLDDEYFCVAANDGTAGDILLSIGKPDGSGGVTWAVSEYATSTEDTSISTLLRISDRVFALLYCNSSSNAVISIFEWDGASTITKKIDGQLVQTGTVAVWDMVNGPESGDIWIVTSTGTGTFFTALNYDISAGTTSTLLSPASISGTAYTGQSLERIGNFIYIAAKDGTSLKIVGQEIITNPSYSLGAMNSVSLETSSNPKSITLLKISESRLVVLSADNATADLKIYYIEVRPSASAYDPSATADRVGFVLSQVEIAPNINVSTLLTYAFNIMVYLGGDLFAIGVNLDGGGVILKYFRLPTFLPEPPANYATGHKFAAYEILDDIEISAMTCMFSTIAVNPSKTRVCMFFGEGGTGGGYEGYIHVRSIHRFQGIALDSASSGEDVSIRMSGIVKRTDYNLVPEADYGYSLGGQNVCNDYDFFLGTAKDKNTLEIK